MLHAGPYIGIELEGALESCDAAELLAKDAGALHISRHAKDAKPFRFAGLA